MAIDFALEASLFVSVRLSVQTSRPFELSSPHIRLMSLLIGTFCDVRNRSDLHGQFIIQILQ